MQPARGKSLHGTPKPDTDAAHGLTTEGASGPWEEVDLFVTHVWVLVGETPGCLLWAPPSLYCLLRAPVMPHFQLRALPTLQGLLRALLKARCLAMGVTRGRTIQSIPDSIGDSQTKCDTYISTI